MSVTQKPRIDSLVVADWAEAISGKLYVMGGGFDTLWAPQFPHVARFAFAGIFKVPWNDTNRRLPIKGWLATIDGEPLGWEMQGELEAGRPPGQRGGDAQIVIAGPVQFEAAEEMSFVLHVAFAEDERQVALRVSPPPFALARPTGPPAA